MLIPSAKHIKALYDRGENVMQTFRESEVRDVNSREAIQVSYDLQAGSYVEALKDSRRLDQQNRYAGRLRPSWNVIIRRP